ncbi:RabGAP/TBC domain-containing protein [Tieghemostelium lacteum]|uniref:RabGAP/TBC domain-containing protein n=1 Tax=Tieghemostelium lacteum TaxID=361077 RepID=A0A152A9Q8_TIELA|nr:RabGAP/TBC domain-containing protein [Tieghemostelium lacteum]|eukprot:KYR02956.1 RabGAP/TBC domain-containing protein [Tieghemostelium lacteum]
MDNSNSGTSNYGGDTFTMDITKNSNKDMKISSVVKGKLESHDDHMHQEEPTRPKVNEFKNEFDRLFYSTIPLEKKPIEVLKQIAYSGSIRFSPIRGFIWRIFLGNLNIDRVGQWDKDIKKQRDSYDELVKEHMFDPRKSGDVYDPLSQNDNSPWKVFFQNQQTQKLIEIDLERTYPDHEFFQNQDNRLKMLRILFVYSKTNGIISYRQGMHELLAPIVYLYDREYKKYDVIRDSVVGSADGLPQNSKHLIDQIYDHNYIEHDIYACFSTLMKYTADWYSPAGYASNSSTPSTGSSSTASTPINTSSTPLGGGLVPSASSGNLSGSFGSVSSPLLIHAQPFEPKEKPDESKHNEAVQKCKYIHSVLLKQKDFELYKHLESLQIEPQIYLLRWIRLIFGREFHLEDLMNIWDCVFAYGDELVLIDYLSISMLAYIRDQLLHSDSIYALKRIYKYPPVEDVYLLVKQAFMIKDSHHEVISTLVKAPSVDKPNPINSTTNQHSTSTSKETTASQQSKVKVVNNNIFSDISFSDLGSFIPFSSQISAKTPPTQRVVTKEDIRSKRQSLPVTTTYNPKTNSFDITIPTPLTQSPIVQESIKPTNTNTANTNITTSNNISSTSKATPQPTPLPLPTQETKKVDLIATSMSINTARNNYFTDAKHATISSTTKHSYITPTKVNTNTEIRRLKNIQKYLGNSLAEIIPILQKSIKTNTPSSLTSTTNTVETINKPISEDEQQEQQLEQQQEQQTQDNIENATLNNNSNNINTSSPVLSSSSVTSSLSLEGSDNLLIAIAKIKDIKNMLLGELPLPEIADDHFETEEDDGTHSKDPLGAI